ncbi:MAG: DUF4230 domain-containing protein [Alkalispirochaetaceae bacterium]
MGRVPSILVTLSLLAFAGCTAHHDSPAELPLERRISSLLELHTVEYVYRDIVYFGEQESFLGIFRTRDQQLLFAVRLRVHAGVDLSKGVEVLRDPENPRMALVRIPSPEVLLVDAEEGSIEQFLVRERGGSIEWDQVSSEMESVKERVRADALEKGILQRAEKNAVELIEDVLGVAGFEEVSVQVLPPEELKG